MNQGLHRFRGFFSRKNAQKAQRHEEKLDGITGLTEIILSRLGVPPNGWRTSLGELCSKSELLTQRVAFVHKAIETAFFKSRLKTVLFSRKDAQNVQKSEKNDQKSVLLAINTPKMLNT